MLGTPALCPIPSPGRHRYTSASLVELLFHAPSTKQGSRRAELARGLAGDKPSARLLHAVSICGRRIQKTVSSSTDNKRKERKKKKLTEVSNDEVLQEIKIY